MNSMFGHTNTWLLLLPVEYAMFGLATFIWSFYVMQGLTPIQKTRTAFIALVLPPIFWMFKKHLTLMGIDQEPTSEV